MDLFKYQSEDDGIMKFILAPDSFKGGMTAKEVATAMERGIRRVYPKAEYVQVPMADGGEGTVQSLVDATGGRLVTKTVTDPLGRNTDALFGILGDGKTAVVEMAAASGIQYVNDETKNPLITTTYGTGELIKYAIEENVDRIIIGIGGSATNDGGEGMAEALGVQFLDSGLHEIHRGGGFLDQLDHLDMSHVPDSVKKAKIVIASDVTNPLIGPNGASAVFGPQKGATPDMIHVLDKNLKHYAGIIKRDTGKDLANYPGAGAAGGLGAGLLAFTDAKMEKGIDIVVQVTGLKEKAKNADVVFTGEGGMDFQTQYGKTPCGVAQSVKEANPDVTVVAIAGNVEQNIDILYSKGIDAIFSSTPGPISLKKAIENGPYNITCLSENVARLIKISKK